ncbi:MAG: GNAT family N-acetyltransferase [Leptolyngbya sp. SIO4C1]|nr:GNAT family N-acetyltransferase [Leptolyngbya sp. SIO4C1]
MLRAANQPDAGWIWDYKLNQSQQQERYEAYSLDVDGLSQGLIFIETQWHRSQLPQRWRLVYIEAIASAPWNRADIEQPPWIKGVGRLLLLFSRQRSVELGYRGRVGLHSLPAVEGFYHRLNMPDYGPDPEKDGLVYFEYGALQS